MFKRISEWSWATLTLLGRNRLTLLGSALATISALLILASLLVGFLGLTNSPYSGIMAFLVLPAVFLAGLLLIPAGLYRDRRRRRRRGGEEVVETPRYPTVDFNKTGVRRAAGIVGLLTLANLFIIAVVSYEGVIYM